jgi:hypothetical protein
LFSYIKLISFPLKTPGEIHHSQKTEKTVGPRVPSSAFALHLKKHAKDHGWDCGEP